MATGRAVEYGRNTDALDVDKGGNELPSKGAEEYGDKPSQPGFLLSEYQGKAPEELTPEEHVALAKKALKLWTAQDEHMSRNLAQWKANHARRAGIPNVQVVKLTDESRWKAVIPLGSRPDALPATNHAADLCRKATAQMFADPPAPEVEPPSGEDEDVEAAKFSERVLLDVQGTHGIDETGTARAAFDRGHVFGSGFVHYWVDPQGGGRVPIQIQAGHDPETGERAGHVNDAEQRMVAPAQPAFAPPADPMTAGVAPGPLAPPPAEPTPQPWPDYEDRYVAKDGSLVDDQAKAATRWAPGLKREILTGRNLRFLPHTAEDIWDADGVVLGRFLAWRKVREMFPAVAEMPEEQKKKLFAFKPEKSEDMLPGGMREMRANKDNEDENLVFVGTVIFETNSEYEDGCYFTWLGDCYVAERRDWSADVEGGKRTLLVPITQYKQLGEGLDNPYGVGLMQILGPGNEIANMMSGAWADHLERFNNPRQFVPSTSILQPKYKHLPRGEMVRINPGGEPKYEEVPEFPRDAKEFHALARSDMDNAAGLGDTAQGLETSDVKSGRHAFAVISQVHAGLSEFNQNIAKGYVRACQIELQLIQAFFTVPQRLKWMGEDGQHREKAWSGADLGSTTDVRIKPGTNTMLSPAAKAQLSRSLYLEDQVLQPAQYKDAISDALHGMIVLEDDPFRMRVKRQIAAWKEGPESGEAKGVPTFTQDPMTGQVVPQLGPDPAAAEIWKPVPSDALPDVAAMRLQEIAKLMASTAYQRWPDPWRIAVDMEFQNMQMAAMPPMPADPNAAPGDANQASAAESGDQNEMAEARALSMGVA